MRKSYAISIKKPMFGQNNLGAEPIYVGEELLADELTPFEYRYWERWYDRRLPRGVKVLVVWHERFCGGWALICGIEKIDWVVKATFGIIESA
jgi:hypothetical protein